MSPEKISDPQNQPRTRWLRILGISAAVCIVMTVLGVLWVRYNLYASPFTPTRLSEHEQQVLNEKLDYLERGIQRQNLNPDSKPDETNGEGRLNPEPYKEDVSKREIRISEKELNSLIAKDDETARRVAIDLSRDMVSLKVLIPVDQDSPILGGKTIRLSCGITLRHYAGKPVVALRGVSIGGVPIPNAWLGGIKNTDLVREFGEQGGFWDTFPKGIENIRVSDSSLYIKLKE